MRERERERERERVTERKSERQCACGVAFIFVSVCVLVCVYVCVCARTVLVINYCKAFPLVRAFINVQHFQILSGRIVRLVRWWLSCRTPTMCLMEALEMLVATLVAVAAAAAAVAIVVQSRILLP